MSKAITCFYACNHRLHKNGKRFQISEVEQKA